MRLLFPTSVLTLSRPPQSTDVRPVEPSNRSISRVAPPVSGIGYARISSVRTSCVYAYVRAPTYPIRRPNTGSLPPMDIAIDVFGEPVRSWTDHSLRNEATIRL